MVRASQETTGSKTGSRRVSKTASKQAGKQAGTTSAAGALTDEAGSNEVRLRGRVAARPEERELPSGDRLVLLRIVVPRDPAARGRRRPTAEGSVGTRVQTVDTIDLVCWTTATRRSASRLDAGDHVEVQGALRRRFFGGPSGRQSRYEVEVAALRRVSVGSSAAT